MAINPFAELTLPHQAYYQALQQEQLLDKVTFNLSDACAETSRLEEVSDFCSALKKSDTTSSDLTYTSTRGSPELRQAISRFHGQANPNHYVTFCGAQEAIFAGMAAILSPGDEVLTLAPAYPPILNTPYLFGAKTKLVTLTAKNNWRIDFDQIEAAITAKTKLIIINQPHNPTGSLLSKAEIQRLWDFVEQNKGYLISDEVAIHSSVNEQSSPSAYKQHPRIMGIGVCSKSLGLAGIRIGWMLVSNEKLRKKILNIKAYLSICTSKVDEQLLTQILKHSDQLIHRNNQYLSQNIKAVAELSDRLGQQLLWQPPAAGLLSLVELPGVSDIIHFSKALISQTGLMILPSQFLGLEGPYFRMGLGKRKLIDHLPTFEAFTYDYLKTQNDSLKTQN